jgi:Ca2+-binding EF-hand superfamily protein
MGLIMTDNERNQMFTEMDTNNDGKISYNEFLNWWHNGKMGQSLK